jgi:hypothetical protein
MWKLVLLFQARVRHDRTRALVESARIELAQCPVSKTGDPP